MVTLQHRQLQKLRWLSVLSLGPFISFVFATEEVKDVKLFSFSSKWFGNLKKDVLDQRLVNSVKWALYLSWRLVWSLFKKFENKCKNKHKVQIKLSKVQTCTTDLASYSLTRWQFWQLTLKWLSGACTQDKTNFFLIFIQLCDSRKIHSYLTREFCVKLHLYREPILLLVYNISSGGRIESFFLICLSDGCYVLFPVIIFRFAVINSDFHRGDEKILNFATVC